MKNCNDRITGQSENYTAEEERPEMRVCAWTIIRKQSFQKLKPECVQDRGWNGCREKHRECVLIIELPSLSRHRHLYD